MTWGEGAPAGGGGQVDEIGQNGALTAVSSSGMGPIYMNEVKCGGQERSIWKCPFKNITSEDCQHAEDAAVRCNVPHMGLENSVRRAVAPLLMLACCVGLCCPLAPLLLC